MPTIADGNPSTLLALQHSAQRAGIELDPIHLEHSSALARPFHQQVTLNPVRARRYVETSELERGGIKGSLFGAVSLAEFALRKVGAHGFGRVQWNVVQELPLRSAPRALLRLLGAKDVRLIVPDVYPKASAVQALRRHPQARVSVWNREAFDELSADGVSAELNRPYLLDGLRPESPTFMAEGVTAVAKVSGSGAPDAWPRLLEIGLQQAGVDYSLHSPSYQIRNGRAEAAEGFEERVGSFYSDLGGQTRLLIGYPSELVGVACELRSRGVPVWMLSLPPRGAHEKRNLEFGYRHGVIHSEINITGAAEQASTTGLPLINLSDLPQVLQQPPDFTLRPDLLGEKSVWE